jgi:hypothetical protein
MASGTLWLRPDASVLGVFFDAAEEFEAGVKGTPDPPKSGRASSRNE